MMKDVIVIGAGAAGLMCAIEAGKRGRSVVVLEHAEKAGRKIAISGGGRCNFTHLDTAPGHFLSANPNFCKSALARYPPADFLSLVQRHGIGYHEKKAGQLFADQSALKILQMLLRECSAARVEIRLNCQVQQVQKNRKFFVQTNQGLFEAESLVVAAGGLSVPKIGATALGYEIAGQFGLDIVETRPGLVPLRFPPAQQLFFSDLTGISIDVVVTGRKQKFRENLLFTHQGLSGPAILQISSYWIEGDPLHIDLLPETSLAEIIGSRRQSSITLSALLCQRLPKHFVHKWCDLQGEARPIRSLSEKDLSRLERLIHDWVLLPESTAGYHKAEVTLGGVDTRELSSKTMESKRVPGLYFIGEVVDVTGQLGGYNFQWAWASGHAAGQFA
jgi:predicted Rossmann fold flavoprotein